MPKPEFKKIGRIADELERSGEKMASAILAERQAQMLPTQAGVEQS
jgi:hypothetical protein